MDYSRARYDNYGRYGSPYFDNSPSWGYVIYYLLLLVGGLIGNTLFCFVVKKNPQLRRTIHFFFMTIAMVDILVCVSVIPFIIDSQSKRFGGWELPDMLCKVYTSLDYGFKGVHAFVLTIAAYFLFHWYRKTETHSTDAGDIITRTSKMHKWGIPLGCVIGIGVSVPSGTLASMMFNECAAWHEYGQLSGTNFSMNLGFLVSSFLLPALLLFVPLVAILMQVCGARSPELNPPHSRTAWSLLLYILLFGLRAPHDVFELMRMLGNQYGNKGDPYRGMDPRMRSPDTQNILNCLVYLPCLLHPLVLFILNPDYRQGLRNVWRNLYCNKEPSSREGSRRRDQAPRYPPPKPIIKSQNMKGYSKRRGEHALVAEVQPMIVPAQKPLLNQMGRKIEHAGYVKSGTPYIPMETLATAKDPLLNGNSFETEHSPQAALPAEFEYGKFKYVDTARVEPKIAYTPTNTPPKTPQMPHFDKAPFKQPNYIDGTWILPEDQEAYRGLMPASQIPVEGYPEHIIPSSSGPVEVDDLPEPMEIESLDNSPGNTLRTARRGKPEVETLTASPGAKRRVGRLEDAPARNTPSRLESAPPRNNSSKSSGRDDRSILSGVGSESRPSSPFDRPASRQNTVEITLTGRSRSRQDLCPDRPRTKYEHAV